MIINYSENTGKQNMDYDLQLLENSIEKQITEPILRFYGWNPSCISLGRNQKDEFLDNEFVNKNNIDVVRRITGGRALFHDNEVTYCFVCPVEFLNNGDHVISSYKEISQFLIDGMADLGIKLDYGQKKSTKNAQDYCMMLSTGADLCYEDKKLIGSAQCRKKGYILQHGSILYDYDKNILEKIFSNKNITQNIVSVKQINPTIKKEDLINAFKHNALKSFKM